jgi:hypothetical protein
MQIWIVALLNRCVERIHVDMDDFASTRFQRYLDPDPVIPWCRSYRKLQRSAHFLRCRNSQDARPPEPRGPNAWRACCSMSPMIRDGALWSIRAGACMYDVYLSGRNGLLVVPRDYSIPSDLSGNWAEVRSVSETIRHDVERRGYHRRSLVGHRSNAASKAPTDLRRKSRPGNPSIRCPKRSGKTPASSP